MAYSKVLNRPMFNKHNSAYGRGIASNLVSDEERQRFNYGGRVGYQDRGLVAPLSDTTPINSPIKLSGNINQSMAPDNDFMDVFGWKGLITEDPAPDFDDDLEQKKKIARAEADRKWKKFQQKPEVKETTEIDVEEDLWSPQEKKEKMGQMQLAMAERLIGGSRDKWGSTAQMKNLAGAIGDVRKITDTAEDRAMKRKYEAWGEAQRKRDLASLKAQQDIVSDKTNRYQKLRDAGQREQDALNTVYDLNITTVSDTDKKKKKDMVSNPSKYDSQIIFDDKEKVYRISRDGVWRTVTVEQIKEWSTQGKV